jgi:hypothetical protein
VTCLAASMRRPCFPPQVRTDTGRLRSVGSRSSALPRRQRYYAALPGTVRSALRNLTFVRLPRPLRPPLRFPLPEGQVPRMFGPYLARRSGSKNVRAVPGPKVRFQECSGRTWPEGQVPRTFGPYLARRSGSKNVRAVPGVRPATARTLLLGHPVRASANARRVGPGSVRSASRNLTFVDWSSGLRTLARYTVVERQGYPRLPGRPLRPRHGPRPRRAGPVRVRRWSGANAPGAPPPRPPGGGDAAAFRIGKIPGHPGCVFCVAVQPAARNARVPTRGAVRTASEDIVAGINGDVATGAARLATGLPGSALAGRGSHPQDGTRISRSHRILPSLRCRPCLVASPRNTREDPGRWAATGWGRRQCTGR